MALVKVKPTSPGRRGVVKVVTPDLYKGKPHAPLLESQSKNAGRNNNGRITVRHQGGGHKQHYRMIDFRRNKDGIPAKVEHIEYDPNRTAHIALLCYADGERRYIIAPRGIAAGAQIISGAEAPIKVGNALPLRNIPVGSTIHCIELHLHAPAIAQKYLLNGQFARLCQVAIQYSELCCRLECYVAAMHYPL